MRNTFLVMILITATSLLVFSVGLANGSPEQVQHVFGSGSTASTSGDVAINATLGQPMIGTPANGTNTIYQGFWGFLEQVYQVYLPLILRN